MLIGCVRYDYVFSVGKYQSLETNVALKEIKFPQNLEEIGESAFVNCYSITCLTLPESLQIIE